MHGSLTCLLYFFVLFIRRRISLTIPLKNIVESMGGCILVICIYVFLFSPLQTLSLRVSVRRLAIR